MINNLFRNPYIMIQILEKEFRINKRTAQNYLDKIVELGFLEKTKVGKSNYYINTTLIKVLMNE